MMKRLEKWRIVLSGDHYDAPEIRRFHLQGVLPSGDKMTSSPIVGNEGDDVLLTRSGARYELGEREGSYVRSFEEMKAAFPHVPLD